MIASIRRVLSVSSMLVSAGLLIGLGNSAWAQRSSADSSNVRSSRGNSDSRAVQSDRSRSDARTRTNRGSSGGRSTRSERSTDRADTQTRAGTDARTRSESQRRTDARTRTDRDTRTRSNADRARDNVSRGTRGAASGTSRGEATRGARSSTRGEAATRAQRDAAQRRRQRHTVRRPAHPQPHVRQRVHVDVRWPWEHRYRRGWSPTYRFRQVVHVDAGWGRHSRRAQLDVRTYYRHRVRSANRNRAQMDVYIERIEIFENGYYLGSVRHIPRSLARMQATMYRGGSARLDRDLFIIGDPDAGFELISTRHYGGFVFDHYRRSHGYRVGVLDFRRDRVREVRRSRFFDPYEFTGFVPISLLPQDEAWISDYGYNAPSRHWYGDDDIYYYGYEDGWGDGVRYDLANPRSATDGRSSALPEAGALQRSDEKTYRTESGAEIRLKREMTLERVD